MAVSSWTRTPSMSVSQHSTGLEVVMATIVPTPLTPLGEGAVARQVHAGGRGDEVREDVVVMALSTSAVTAALPVTDTGRAREFYSERLGLALRETNAEGSLVYDLDGGARLMLLPREAGTQNPSTALTWEVADVATELADLQERGVAFEDYDLPGLTTVDHVADLDGERAAWFLDPDGNVLCIHEGRRG
jgi:catechol 2,3-dioxygenase-like lactoylglutathione lyase family enzyme